MKASIGDMIRFKDSRVVGGEQVAEIIDVLGPDGAPPYRVRFPNGHETLVSPPPGSEVIPKESD
ncbi:hypothetical protein BDV30DRAFT_205906 [Aspergillus minisclerotigenes]|uniref:DUF1918 domain-containing protein n=1 Tax=Aspergillus minisclerotigenes TaxID=656917 RepID=A0A5N6JDJ9_9EURO|nr:hypothetical protein BDV30DRAFT_205906 [Aspergillus minisclerotigenes]